MAPWNRGDIGKAISPETGEWNKVIIKKAAYSGRCNGIKCNRFIKSGDLHGAGNAYFLHFCLSCMKPMDYEGKRLHDSV